MKTKDEISLIIPFLNERENIPFLLQSLNDFFTTNDITNCEVIFVDDGSTDESITAFKQASTKHLFSGKIIRLSKNYGSHAAIRAGLLHAKGNAAIFLPADLQDPLQLIITLSAKASEGYDIVFASRNNSASGALEKYFSRLYARLMQKFVVRQFPENGFDVVFFNRKVIDSLNNNIESNSSIMLQIMTLGFAQSFVTYNKLERKQGVSKWTLSKKIKLLIDSFVAFSFAPIRIVSFTGILFFIVGFIWSFYLISRKLIVDDLTSGWPALYSTLLMGFGITNISLGIIAEYLWRTLDASRKRPAFIIDKVIELNTEHPRE